MLLLKETCAETRRATAAESLGSVVSVGYAVVSTSRKESADKECVEMNPFVVVSFS
jgi:hypothetical protein